MKPKNKMKILYIANARIPTEKAHGMQIMKMCEVFSELGNKLELIIPTRVNTREFKKLSSFEHYRIKKIFQVIKIVTLDPTPLVKLPAGIYAKVQFSLFIFNLFFHLILKRNRRDYIIYTRDELLLPLLHLLSDKVVWEAHSLPSNHNRYKKHFKKCLAIMTLTERVKEDLIELGVSDKKIMVSPDAVDLDIFDINLDKEQARKDLSLPQDKIILGYTGSFKTKGMDKGIDDIIRALKLIDNKDIIFTAVGGSATDIEYYRDIADRAGVGERILFFGPVDQNKLAVYQKAFDVLLMPFPHKRHYAYYMSPLKMFEYMAAKRPIVASNLPTIREILSEETSFICQPDDPVDLAKKIEAALNDKERAKKISDNAYNEIDQYTWDKRGQKILDFIKLQS